MDSARVAVVAGLAESVTRTVKLQVPVRVGIPATTPVIPFSFSPGGNEPAASDHLSGAVPPLLPSALEYA
jgi:hypothetical protein